MMKSFQPAPDGRKPNIVTIRNWIHDDGWHEHADVLDAELSLKLDKEAIETRARVLKKLAEDGAYMKDAGLTYIRSTPEPFKDNPSAAVRAVVAGSEMEFKYSGMAESLIQISQMNDKQLTKRVMHLLGKNENNDEIIELDSELVSEDVPGEDGNSNPQDDLG